MTADYHIHTSFSIDSDYAMEEVAARAVFLGLDEICVTEHLDYFQNGNHHLVDYESFFREAARLQELYRGRLTIRAGAEFGVQISQTERFRKVFSEYPFDFVLLSNHEVGDLEFWNGDFQKGKEQAQYNREYYEAIYEVTRTFKDYSVLAHLDMIKRYDPAGILEDSANEELIREILKQVVQDGKGLEVNTSCFRYGLPDLTPSRTILKWYREAGGEILTIGSDSHKESDLGSRIRETQEELKHLGFRYFMTFQRMKPEARTL